MLLFRMSFTDTSTARKSDGGASEFSTPIAPRNTPSMLRMNWYSTSYSYEAALAAV